MSHGFSRKNHGNSHSYFMDGQRLPGVTSIIGVLDKPALVNWASETTARYAVENWERLSGMSFLNRYEELKKAREHTNREATVRGKRIHSLAERIMRGDEVSPDDRSLRAAAQAYVDLLDAWDLQPVTLEMPCVNLEYRYAGTADGIFESPKLGRLIVDIKTGRKAYDEVALQLAAYRYTDIYLEEEEQFGPRGGKLKSLWHERPMIPVDGAAVIHIERETDESPAMAHLQPVQAGEDIWQTFLQLNDIHAFWVQRTAWKYRESPTYNPPVGAPIHPEMDPAELQELIRS